jgi:hypothetical protein
MHHGQRVAGTSFRRVAPRYAGPLAQRPEQARSGGVSCCHGRRVAGNPFRRVDPRYAGPLAQRLKGLTPTRWFPMTDNPHEHLIYLTQSSHFTVIFTVNK